MHMISIPYPAISVVQIRQLSGIGLQLILSGCAGLCSVMAVLIMRHGLIV